MCFEVRRTIFESSSIISARRESKCWSTALIAGSTETQTCYIMALCSSSEILQHVTALYYINQYFHKAASLMSKLWVQIHKNGSADAQNKCIHYDQLVKTLGNRLMIVFWCAIGLPARGAGLLIPLLSCWHANSIRSTSLGGNLIHWGNVLFHSGLLKICLISCKIHENFISYMLTFTSRCYTTNSLVHQSSSSVVCHHRSI